MHRDIRETVHRECGEVRPDRQARGVDQPAAGNEPGRGIAFAAKGVVRRSVSRRPEKSGVMPTEIVLSTKDRLKDSWLFVAGDEIRGHGLEIRSELVPCSVPHFGSV